MRTDHVQLGQRVELRTKRHRGMVGVVTYVGRGAARPGSGFTNCQSSRVTVRLECGQEVVAMPRWVEPALKEVDDG